MRAPVTNRFSSVPVIQHPPVFLNLEANIEGGCSLIEAACRLHHRYGGQQGCPGKA